MDFLTREFFDTLIFAVIAVGIVLAVFRLHRDFTRPIPPRRQVHDVYETTDTQETPTIRDSAIRDSAIRGGAMNGDQTKTP